MEKFRRLSFVRSLLLAHRANLFRGSALSQTKCKIFELTTQRLKITSGIFSKVTETLELYRVKDIETRQPFLSRMVGVENVQMNTLDASSPFVFIEAVPSSVGLADKLRNQVEIIRQQKRVREIDIEERCAGCVFCSERDQIMLWNRLTNFLQPLRLMDARLLWLSLLRLSVCWSACVFVSKCVRPTRRFRMTAKANKNHSL